MKKKMIQCWVLWFVLAAAIGCQSQDSRVTETQVNNRRSLIEEDLISFQTNDGTHYIAAEDGGGKEGEYIGSWPWRRPTGLAVADRTHRGSWETFNVYNCGDGYFSFRAPNGGLLSAQPDGTLVFNRERAGDWCPGAWEAFKVEPAGDGTVSLITDHGTRVIAENSGGGRLFHEARDSIGPWERFSLSRPLGGSGPIAIPGVDPGIHGYLRLENGGGFFDNRGAVLPIYAHGGDFFTRYANERDVDGLVNLLRLIKQARYDGVRVWITLGEINGCHGGGYWAGRAVGPDCTPDYWNKLHGFLALLRDLGLKCHLTLGDIRPEIVRDRFAFADRLAETIVAVGPEVVGPFEGANESRDTGEPDPVRLAQFVQRVIERVDIPVRGLSAFTGHEDISILDRFSRAPANLFFVHSYRGGRWWDKVRHIFSTQYGDPHKPRLRNGWNGEGPGNGVLVSAIDNKHEMEAGAYQMLAAMALMSREGFVWFSGPGVISDCKAGERVGNNVCNGEQMQDMPGFWETPRVKDMLPADIMRYEALFHGGRDARRTFAATDPDTRVDHAWYRDGRTCSIEYGPRPGSARQIKHIDPVTHDTTIPGYGRIVCGTAH